MKSNISLLLTLLVFSDVSNAQNLVPNGSFESYTALPNSTSDWELCVGWNNVNMSLANWPMATPDYLHASGSGDAQLPNSKWATVNPQDGNAIMGLYSRHGSQTDARDYVSTQLTSPLTIGTTYEISFWLSSGSGNHFYGSSSSNFGVQLTTSPMTQNDHESLGGTPQAMVTSDPWHAGWVFYSFTYLATSAHQYITVGNFMSDALTTTTVHNNSANFPAGSYYFVDDIRVEPISTLPVELVRFDAANDAEVVVTSWETENEVNNDFFTVQRSDDGKNWQQIGIVDGAGNSEDNLSYEFVDERPLAGLSYYRLMQTDFDGQTSHSGVKSVMRELEKGTEIEVFPNPTADNVTIRGNIQEIKNYRVFDALGAEVTGQVLELSDDGMSTVVLDFSSLPAGVYVYKTTNAIKKIVKR